jgi:O-antigen polymerase
MKSKDKVNIIYFSAVTLIFTFALLMNTGKQIFFMIIIATSALIGINKIRQVIVITIIAIGLFATYMVLLRGYGGSLEYYISLYLVSPTVAFQEYYFNHHPGMSISSNLFWFFERLSGFISGTNSHMIIHKEFVNVGVRTNVYTAFADYIYYSTFLCVVLTSIHGMLIGALWRSSSKNWIAAIFYALFCYSAIFLFYHESFIVNISSWVQILFAIFIVGKLSKVIAKS